MENLSLQEIITHVNAWQYNDRLDFEQQVKVMAKQMTFHNASKHVYRKMASVL